MKLAFLGLGVMGYPMAGHLARAGHRVTVYNRTIVEQYLREGIDVLEAGDDLGTQTASMISPAMFRQWITPAYQQIFTPVRAAGGHVSLHSDGHMIELIDEKV